MPGHTFPPARHEPRRRAGPIGLAVAALSLVVVAAVAVLAGGSRGDDARFGVPEVANDTLLDVAFAAAIIYGLVLMALLGKALFNERAGEETGRAPRWLFMIIGMAQMGAVMWFAFQGRPPTTVELDPIDIDLSVPETVTPSTPVVPADPPSAWVWLVAVLLVAAAAGIVWWTWRGVRRPAPDVLDAEERLRQEQRSVADLLDEAIDDLRRHPDPRIAVIAAFARFEAGLAVVGIRREVADTPLGYLQRVLDHVEVSAPAVARLTEAYEEAKYSQHEITRRTQLAAVDALVEVRDELRVLTRRVPMQVGA
jgi:hypothetical protein